jgi:hypothetical protein
MRLLFEQLREYLARLPTISPATLFAGGGVVLAAVVVVYGALLGADRVPEDAVAVSGPVFTPVATTAPAPARAARPTTEEAIPRFEDEMSVTRAVQAELKRAGCYSGPVNGVWSASTRAGMGEFATRVNARLPVDRPDPVLLALLETHNKISCTAGCSMGGEDECVPRAAPPPAQRAEAREEPLAAPPPAGASAGSDDLGDTAAPRVPGPPTTVETASAGREDGTELEDAAAAAAAGTVAGAAAQKATKPRPQRTSRKQPSLSQQVSKGFQQIQRSLDKLF